MVTDSVTSTSPSTGPQQNRPGIPSQAGEAARGTLGGAVAVAEQLPVELGTALLATARDSFTQGLVLAAAISAALMIATGVVTAIVLRRRHRLTDRMEGGIL
jgi:DHA2 family multidrug resistance protein-like MFS transporter